jgi:hypothetical protein
MYLFCSNLAREAKELIFNHIPHMFFFCFVCGTENLSTGAADARRQSSGDRFDLTGSGA